MTRKKSRSRHALSRRTVLRGLLGGSVLSLHLPLLDAMLDDNGVRLANGAAIPKRFGVFYWGGGIVHDTWVPAQTGANFDLPDSLQPFDDPDTQTELRDYLSLVTGTSHASTSPGHIPARGIALSSSHDLKKCTGDDCVGVYRGHDHPEPSVDALVAAAWAGQTPYKSLEVSICQEGPYKNNSSWVAGGTTYNRHEPSPVELYKRIFGGLERDPADPKVVTARAFEQSMLDAVLADANSLTKRLGHSDRLRMEQHLDGLRAIEAKLTNPGAGGCVIPTEPTTSDYVGGNDIVVKELKSQLMSQLLAVALACDLTRVFSYEWSATQSLAIYSEIGVNQEHHELNHQAAKGDAQKIAELKKVTRFIMKNLAYLAQQLKAQPLGGAGTLLDHTLILGTSEHAKAGDHTYKDHPFVLVGAAGGTIKGGWHHRETGSGNRAPDVLLTAVRAVEPSITALGQENSGGGKNRRTSNTISAVEA